MIGLLNGLAALPQGGPQRVKRVAAVHRFRSLQMLEGVDRLDLFQILGPPLDVRFRLGIVKVFEEVGNLVLTDGAIEDGMTLEDRDLDAIGCGEKQALPILLAALFDGEEDWESL